MNNIYHPKDDLQFGIFSKKLQQFKFVGKGSTQTPGTLCAIPSVVLNILEKPSLRKPNFRSKRVDPIYPGQINALIKAGLLPSVLPKMWVLWKFQDEKMDHDK